MVTESSCVLAFDLGASSGRAMLGRLENGTLSLTEIHRFPNDRVQAGGGVYWDILRLYHEIKLGIGKALREEPGILSLGIDSWAVDYGLIGPDGELLGNPYHYRDSRTDGCMEELGDLLGKDTIFGLTGIQFLPFNTIYQLYAARKTDSSSLKQASKLLMIPDLLRYFLTGEMKSEFTNASTTQLLNPASGEWEPKLLEAIGLPVSLFLPPVQPGTPAGTLQASVTEELGVPPLPVIAVAEHDTASAVAAVPAEGEEFAYLSCGTWSLMGTELNRPVLTPQALEWNFTNEGGVNGTFRLLKNIMGLWLIQECRSAWEKEGDSRSFAELVQAAAQAKPFRSLIDPDHRMFIHPAHMPKQIQSFCRETGQPVPESKEEIIRCVMESLALQYRSVLQRTEELSGRSFNGLHMVGGGIHNTVLCQYTANAIGRPVWAGPAEGSAIGNAAVQLISLGKISGIQEARDIIRRSFPVDTYLPEEPAVWEEAYRRFAETIIN
ncbi:rhamnulokinase [Paenibacillus sp. CC-CFT747]|nr:rhamnulokinase [Paenibacillus sp. CC-CFT747]